MERASGPILLKGCGLLGMDVHCGFIAFPVAQLIRAYMLRCFVWFKYILPIFFLTSCLAQALLLLRPVLSQGRALPTVPDLTHASDSPARLSYGMLRPSAACVGAKSRGLSLDSGKKEIFVKIDLHDTVTPMKLMFL